MGNEIQRPPPRPYSRRGGPPIEQSGRTLDNGSSDGGDASQGAPPSDISPIACAFGHEVLLGSIVDLSDLAASYSRSAAEAAWAATRRRSAFICGKRAKPLRRRA
jgi:hypothetical protein